MEKICNDAIFGEMEYKHGWVKNEEFSFLGEPDIIRIHAKAYTGKRITEEQRVSYRDFKNNRDGICEKVRLLLTEYINSNIAELSASWDKARKIVDVSDLSGTVRLRTLLFKQDGEAIMLFDCAWDSEHGVAVQVYPEYKIGSQDLFL